MFKPLLRTLPSLSGNFTLACPLNYVTKVDKDRYVCNIRTANIVPLQNSISNPINTEINLLSSKYEFDVAKYYQKLVPTTLFFESTRTKNVNSLPLFDLVTNNDYVTEDVCMNSRNTDYEFGVKRVSNSLFGYQFMFYAPIYIDDVKSLPDTFEIHIKYYNRTNKGDIYNTFDKVISINIGKSTNINYLKKYLTNYVEKIDSKVLDINTYYKRGIYYGIDVKNGGLQAYKYDNLRKIYAKYINILDFDEILSNGFKETSQVMRQVIPISFLFNISDFLTENENRYMYAKRFNISGYYCTNEYKHKFYDFDFDYRDLYARELLFDDATGNIGYSKTNNIMNVNGGYHEKYLKNIFYKNKVTPRISRWKMIYSTDNDPYFINANYSFSTNQTGNYGNFPNASVSNNVYGLLEKTSNDSLTDENYVSLELYNTAQNIEKYQEVMYGASGVKTKIEHYYTSWFNISLDKELSDEQFSISGNWSNIVNEYSYFKGILYNVSDLLDKYNNRQSISSIYDIDDIDYFGVFLNITSSYLDQQEFDKIKTVRYYIESSNKTNNVSINTTFFNNEVRKYEQKQTRIDDETIKKKPLNVYNQLFNFSTGNPNYKIENDGIFRIDEDGDYVNFVQFANTNMYIKTSDIMQIFPEDRARDLAKFKESYSANAFDNYYKIEISSDSVATLSDMYNSDEFKETGINRNALYVSKRNSSNKSQLIANLNRAEAPFTLFHKTSFISVYDFIMCYKRFYKDEYEKWSFKDIYRLLNVNNIIGQLMYEYVPRYYSGDVLLTDYMSKKIKYENKQKVNSAVLSTTNYVDYLYIDSYNLSNYIKRHNKVNDNKQYHISKHILDVTPHKMAYIRLENVDMITEYCQELFKDNKRRNKLYKDNMFVVKKLVKMSSSDVSTKYSGKKMSYEQFKKLYDAGLNNDATELERIIIDDNNDFVYQRYNENGKDIDEEYAISFYYYKKIYLLTSELYKLFTLSTDKQITFDQLYVLVKEDDGNEDQYYLQNGYEQCIDANNCYKFILNNNLYKNNDVIKTLSSIIQSNKIDSSETIIVSPNEKKIVYQEDVIMNDSTYNNNLQIFEQLHGEGKISGSRHKKPKRLTIFFKKYHKTHRTFKVYKYKNYYSDLFVNINLLPKDAQESIRNQATKTGKPMSVIRYSKHNSLDMDSSYINVKENDGKLYLYVVVDVALDNTSLSFNLDDKYVHERFNFINGDKLTKSNIDKLFSKYYHYLLCLVKDNIFKKFLNDHNTSIVVPETLYYINKYNTTKLDDSKTNNLYRYRAEWNDYNNMIISINRYFSSCTPYLKETSTVPSYYSKFMIKYDELVKNGNYQHKLTNVDDSMIIHIEDINIYEANKIRLIDSINKVIMDDPITFFEYKHFNNSLQYNLEKEFTIEYPGIVDKQTLDAIIDSKNDTTFSSKSEWNYFNNSIEFKLFKEYVQRKYLYDDENNYENITMYDIHFLFLFNKYNISYIVKNVYTDLINNKDMYKIVYTYTLI